MIVWGEESSGVFIVRSGYKILMHGKGEAIGARNKLIHEKNVILPHDIIYKVESYIQEVDELQRKLPTRRVGSELNLERNLGFQEVLIEGDALSLIKKIQACDIDDSLIRAYIHDAKHKPGGFDRCDFHHIQRDANRVTDILAKEGLKRGKSLQCFFRDEIRLKMCEMKGFGFVVFLMENVIVFSLGLLFSMDREISGFGNEDQLLLC
ncbi:hypothetical protein Goshw_003271 [Gossypium schwendimanii]|uniref:RNase H type-1 domain-containing protein n=1 Tax=Gossypium schwendimanii TaxID=34291 RepID=A0A7J9MFP4_GOSSC|nr:hypothetical protein [Gossypium schwendimanii]